MFKIFRGGRGGGWGGEGSSERCLKWGGGGVITGIFLKAGVDKGKNLFKGGRGF